MKLVVRVLAFAIVAAGFAAAAVSPTAKHVASHQSATMGNPVPSCFPGVPGCPKPH